MNTKAKAAIILLACALIASLAANGILGVLLAKEKKDSLRYLYDPKYAIGSDRSDTDEPVEETNEPRFQITTQCITLSLPETLQDKIVVDTAENEQSTNITVTSKGYEQEAVLFSVALSRDEPDGYILGVLKDKTNGQWNVAVDVKQISSEDWSSEQYSELCTLQEYVNDIMIQLQEDPRFVPNK